MDDSTHELADLIYEFLGMSLESEAREQITAAATELGVSYEQFLAMSLTQLITDRFQLTPTPTAKPEDETADDVE